MVKQLSRNEHILNFLLGLGVVSIAMLGSAFMIDPDLISDFHLAIISIIIIVASAFGAFSMWHSIKALYKIDKRAEKFGR